MKFLYTMLVAKGLANAVYSVQPATQRPVLAMCYMEVSFQHIGLYRIALVSFDPALVSEIPDSLHVLASDTSFYYNAT